jgi:hypothetical protein
MMMKESERYWWKSSGLNKRQMVQLKQLLWVH